MPEIVQALAEHEGLVHWVVRRQCLGELTYTEALQAGRIGLWQALRRYDPQRGYAFSSYAVPAIKHAIWREVTKAKLSPQEVLTPYPPQAVPEVDEIVERVLVWEALSRLLSCLPHRLLLVIVARYGLTGEAPQTFAAIGRRLGVTRQRAHQLHAEALLWLADPAHSLALRRLLDRNRVTDYRVYLRRLRTWLRARRARR
jgi:RNA polymerase sigma factor (sigma-70 family)